MSRTPSRASNGTLKMGEKHAPASTEATEASNHNHDAPFSSTFFAKDPATRNARAFYFKALGGGLVMMTIAIWTVLPIYWGALWKTEQYVHGIEAWFVDYDGGQIGQALTQAISQASAPDMFTWKTFPASSFPGGPSDLVDAVLDEKCWFAVVVNSGASNNLSTAVQNADTSYNGTRAITAFGNEARNENGYDFLIKPILDGFLQEVTLEFNIQFVKLLGSQSNANLTRLLSNAPTLVAQPAGYTIEQLRPFDIPVATAIDFVGLIYLLIISFIVAMINFNTRVMSGFERRLTLRALIRARLIIPLIAYFPISLLYSLVSLAFQAPFDRYFGKGGFVVYWMLSYCGMLALGLAMEAMITLLTPRFIPFFLILWIISNVSVAFFPIEVLPKVFRYGYATPFYNVSAAVRTILFSTKNNVGLNFGVLFAWIAISMITIPLFTWFMRRREVNTWRRAQREKGEQGSP